MSPTLQHRRRPGARRFMAWAAGLLLLWLSFSWWPAPSPQMRLVKLGHAIGKRLTHPATALHRLKQRQQVKNAPPPRFVLRLATVTLGQQDGLPYFKVQPRQAASRLVIVYLHGGGYVSPLDLSHWYITASLLRATGATVILPLYPLAPQHTYRDTYPPLTALYRQLLHQYPASNIVLGGESAGGGLALALTMQLRQEQLPLPGRLLLFYPWVDLTMSNPAIAAAEPGDPVLTAAGLREFGTWWAGGDEVRSPRLSPLYGDKRGLPPVSLYQGTADLLWPDAQKLAAQLAQAGVSVDWHEYPGAYHGFLAVPFLPETRAAFQQIAQELSTP